VSRSTLAFLVAPFWVSLLITPYAYLMFPYPDQNHWVVVGVVLGVLFGYGGKFLFGILMLWFLQALRVTTVWVAATAGFLIGAITSLGFVIAFILFFTKGDFRALAMEINLGLSDPRDLVFLLWSGSLGIIVGITFWIIARPDRQYPKTS